MAEERVLYLFRNLNSNLEDFSGNFRSLNPDFLQDVAKNVSSLITDADGSASNRTSCIELLKRLCISEEDHVIVNGSNYETFIEASQLGRVRDDLDVQPFTEEKRKSFLDEAAEFYNAKLRSHNRRMERLAYINTQNQKSFSDLDYTPSKKLENFTEIMQTLRGFKVQEPVSEEVTSVAYVPVEKRQSDVKLAYAVLHLDSKQKDTVIENLLAELEGRRPLVNFEIEFLYYLFKVEVACRTKVLDLFPFLMELSTIEVSTKLFDREYDFDTDPQYAFLQECAKLSYVYKDRIVSIFYELFALNGYDMYFLTPIFSIS